LKISGDENFHFFFTILQIFYKITSGFHCSKADDCLVEPSWQAGDHRHPDVGVYDENWIVANKVGNLLM